MSALAIELNDAGVIVLDEAHCAEEATPPSPGIALLDGERLVTGLSAMRRSRLKPRFVHSRFWDELDTQPLPRPFPRNMSRADLAHAHLEAIWKPVASGVDAVVLAVPGFHADRELGLLLGIARACSIPVCAMIDSAVAASAIGFSGEKLVHLDLHLHRAVATKLRRTSVLARGRVEWSDGVGLLALHDGWARLIAEIFVRETRFDPFHLAESEQALYLHLPRWLEELCHRSSTVIRLETGGKERFIELAREHVVRWAAPYYELIGRLLNSQKSPDGPTTVLLSHRLAGLPGLEERLSGDSGAQWIRLPAMAAASGALRHRERIRSVQEDEAITFVTQLPVEDPIGVESPAGEAASSVVARPVPTHILYDAVAHPITVEPFHFGVGVPEHEPGINLAGAAAGVSRLHCRIYRRDDQVWVEDLSTYGTFVNGRRVNGKLHLSTGDRLRFGSSGIEVQLIAVVGSHGASRD